MDVGKSFRDDNESRADMTPNNTAKELNRETGLYYYGARYYDPRTSVLQSTDPALGDFLPTNGSGKSEELPGMGGVFNAPNLALYTYVQNNPLKYLDRDGLETKYFAIHSTVGP